MNNNITDSEDIVIYNGHIPENIHSYNKDDMNDLILGKSYEILERSNYMGNYGFGWYRIKINEFKLWFPSVSFNKDVKRFMSKKYGLK